MFNILLCAKDGEPAIMIAQDERVLRELLAAPELDLNLRRPDGYSLLDLIVMRLPRFAFVTLDDWRALLRHPRLHINSTGKVSARVVVDDRFAQLQFACPGKSDAPPLRGQHGR